VAGELIDLLSGEVATALLAQRGQVDAVAGVGGEASFLDGEVEYRAEYAVSFANRRAGLASAGQAGEPALNISVLDPVEAYVAQRDITWIRSALS
jgi:hypothetical protein